VQHDISHVGKELTVPASVSCLLSVTSVRPTQLVEIFRNFSTLFGTLAIRWPPWKILRRSSQENPWSRWLNIRRVAKYRPSDFGHVKGYISETVQDVM